MVTENSTFRIGDKTIGDGFPCYIIAEAGINHNGSLEMAKKLVDAACDAGADAVKFQMRNLHHCYPDPLLKDSNLAEWGFNYIITALKDTDLKLEEFRILQDYCKKSDIEFLCTPWDIPSLTYLEELQVKLYKISSADLVNLPLIDTVAATGKPIILSTGMATETEIDRTVQHLLKRKISFALLHCVSAYPASFDSLNLRFMKTLQQRYDILVGYSGHERGISIPVVARVLGACIIEKHITLDRTLPGPDHAASLEPYGFKKMVRDIRVAEIALGKPEKVICQIEQINRHILRKSLLAARDISAGERIDRDMIRISGPGKGISPQRIDELIDAIVHRNIRKDDYFVEGDLQPEHAIEIDRSKLERNWGLKARFHDLDEMLVFEPNLIEIHLSATDVQNGFPDTMSYCPNTDLYVHAPEFFGQRLLDLASMDARHRGASVSMLQKVIDLSEKIARRFRSLKGIIVHAGGMTLDGPADQKGRILEMIVEGLRPLVKRNSAILPENLPPRPWYLGGQWFQNALTSPEDMLCIHRELKCNIAFDVCHAQLSCTMDGNDLDSYIDRIMGITAHVHLSDASGIAGEGLQIGEGTIDWHKTLAKLREYNFTWVPEIWSGHLNNAAGFQIALSRVIQFGGL